MPSNRPVGVGVDDAVTHELEQQQGPVGCERGRPLDGVEHTAHQTETQLQRLLHHGHDLTVLRQTLVRLKGKAMEVRGLFVVVV